MNIITIARWGPVRRIPEIGIEIDLMLINQHENLKLSLINFDLPYISPHMSNPRLENIHPILVGYSQVIEEVAPETFYDEFLNELNMIMDNRKQISFEEIIPRRANISLIATNYNVDVIPVNQLIFPLATLKYDWNDKYPIGYGLGNNTFLSELIIPNSQIYI